MTNTLQSGRHWLILGASSSVARTLCLQGDAAASRQAYEALFQLWKDADRDLPQWLAAQHEYEKLK